MPIDDESSPSGHFGGITPFKVQVNFDIPIFEGQIDVDAIENWLNLLECYFSVHSFSNRGKIFFALLKVVSHVKDWWETSCEKRAEEPSIFTFAPSWNSFRDFGKNTIIWWGAMRTSTLNGLHCGNKGIEMCMR